MPLLAHASRQTPGRYRAWREGNINCAEQLLCGSILRNKIGERHHPLRFLSRDGRCMKTHPAVNTRRGAPEAVVLTDDSNHAVVATGEHEEGRTTDVGSHAWVQFWQGSACVRLSSHEFLRPAVLGTRGRALDASVVRRQGIRNCPEKLDSRGEATDGYVSRMSFNQRQGEKAERRRPSRCSCLR